MKSRKPMSPEQLIDRIIMNRANSQHSTGPKTEAGKLRSSQNALRHGLTSQVALLPSEDPQVYERHLKSFTGEYNPQGVTEANLVQALADTAWRLNRIVAIESRLLTEAARGASLESQSKILANLSLHSQRLSRQFEKTVAQLRDLQQTRRTQEKQDMDNLLDLMEMHKSKGETYRPSEDGFVFSELQINEAVRTRTRHRQIAKAASAQ
jgi:hypothetical protein